MKKIISEACAACLIVVFLWVSYWMAAVIETGIPMPKHVFVIAAALYGGIVVGVIIALAIGVVRLLRRHVTKEHSSALYINGNGEFYTKK